MDEPTDQRDDERSRRLAPGAKVRVPPPLLFLTVIMAAGLLQRFSALELPLPSSVGEPVGVVFTVAAIALVLGAGGLFRRSGQDVRPWLNAPELIVSGVYRFTRNPMYLAMTLVQAGLGLLFASPWLLLLVPLSMVLVYLTAIKPEEAYLEQKFQDSYRAYTERVRRWL